MKKVIVAVVVLGVLGVLGWQIYIRVKEAEGEGGPGRRGGRGGKGVVVAVEVAPVRKATIREVGRFTGSLFPRFEFVVAPKVAGRLEKLKVDVGDPVAAGQLIAELDDDEYVQQIEQARAERAVAEATVAECKSSLEVASRELGRIEALRKKKVASESELDEASARHTACDAKHKVALAEVTRREAALKAAEVRSSYTRIRVSWESGTGPRVVGERFVDEGEMLKPNTPIVSILDNRVMTAVIYVIERDYPKIKLGQAAEIETDPYPGETFEGKIVRIAPLLKETSRQARVEIEIPNADQRLKKGFFARARIEFRRHENATVVPVAALARREGRQGVFVADREKLTARFVPLKLGIVNGEVAEVADPPLSGFVVTLGYHLLEDGAAIRLPEPGPSRSQTSPPKTSADDRRGGRP